MAYDMKLAERIRATLEDRSKIQEKEMFGGICFLSDDKMFVGVVKDELMARLGPENTDRMVEQPHVRRMDFTGKPMAGYVFVSPEGLAGNKLGKYVAMALEFVATVKKRPKKPKRKKAAPAVLKSTRSIAKSAGTVRKKTAAAGKATAGKKVAKKKVAAKNAGQAKKSSKKK